MRTGIHSVSKPRAQSRTGSCWHRWPVWTTPGNGLALGLSSCLDSHTTWTRGMRLQCSFPLLPLFHAAPSCVRTQRDRAPNHNKTVPQSTAKPQVIQPFLQTCPASARPGELLLCPSPACLEPGKPRPHLVLGELRAVAACPHPLHPQQELGGQQPPANWGEKVFAPF